MTERTLWGAGAAFALCDVRDVREKNIAGQREMHMPEHKIRKVMKIAKEPVSMETQIGGDEDSHLGDFAFRGAGDAC